ncbi:MAG: Uma2 family endonuclease [Chloroflexia bacterium]|nr:Uma2 family endonuclease [Chloroflexia bacterium]
MVVAQRMSEQEYEQFVMSGVEGAWELHDGVLVEKPGMSFRHGEIPIRLGYFLLSQLDWSEYSVVVELRVRRSSATVFMPDLMVVPTAYSESIRDRPVLAIYSDPIPLVVEVWSPSTGDYDVQAKLPVYQQRGDLEIWLIHPYERTLTSWERQEDGTYRETIYRGGMVAPAALPGVAIDLDALFDV